MKLDALYNDLRADIATVAQALSINPATADGGKTGLKTMWSLLTIVSRNRAFDDTHPGFAAGHWPRLLPHDGRDYCWYYADGANDAHVSTLLRKIKMSFSS